MRRPWLRAALISVLTTVLVGSVIAAPSGAAVPDPGPQRIPKTWKNGFDGAVPALEKTARAPSISSDLIRQVREANERLPTLDKTRYKSDELLVRFDSDVSDARRRESLEAVSAVRVGHPGYYEELELVRLEGKGGLSEAIARLEGDRNVLYAEPNYAGNGFDAPTRELEKPEFSPRASVNDPLFPLQWNMTSTRAPEAWDTTGGSSGTVIANLDTGIDPYHPDITFGAIAGMVNLGGGDPGWPWDAQDHGTHVSGIAMGRAQNGFGMAGLAHWSRLAAIKVYTDGGTTVQAFADRILSGLQHAAYINAKVVNLEYQQMPFSGTIQAQLQQMSGTFFVAPAGNYTRNVSFGSGVTDEYPCQFRLPNVACVAASTSAETVASYSNFDTNASSPTIHLAAPGGEGQTPVLSATAGTGWFGWKSGTSMAAPHVAGAAALIHSLRPNVPPVDIRNLLVMCGAYHPAMAPKVPSSRRLDNRCPIDFLLQYPWWHQ